LGGDGVAFHYKGTRLCVLPRGVTLKRKLGANAQGPAISFSRIQIIVRGGKREKGGAAG